MPSRWKGDDPEPPPPPRLSPRMRKLPRRSFWAWDVGQPEEALAQNMSQTHYVHLCFDRLKIPITRQSLQPLHWLILKTNLCRMSQQAPRFNLLCSCAAMWAAETGSSVETARKNDLQDPLAAAVNSSGDIYILVGDLTVQNPEAKMFFSSARKVNLAASCCMICMLGRRAS